MFRPIEATPAPALGIAAQQVLAITFSDVLDPASVTLDRVRAVTTSGSDLAIAFAPSGDQILVMPPAGGWGSKPFALELHRGIRAQDGRSLSSPVFWPMDPL